MLNLNGAKLPDKVTLSDYIRNQSEAVRVTGLRPGQVFDVDVSLDGGYLQPDRPVKAGWVSPDGTREGVHTALLTITDGTGFIVNFVDGAELRQSRGRGLSVSSCKDFVINDAWVSGARTAGIAVQQCGDFTFNMPVTVDTSNYQTNRVDVEEWNVAGSIKIDNCTDYTVNDAVSIDHQGNGITATESKRGTWNRPSTIAVHGANMYLNASPDHTIVDGLVVGTKADAVPAYVLNWEKENVGPDVEASDRASILNCYALDSDWGFGIWGNEGQKTVLTSVTLKDCLLIAQNLTTKIHARTTVENLDETGTIYLDPATLPDGTLSNLRAQAAELVDLVRSHASWPVITERRAALVAAMQELRGPIKPPVEPPTDDTKQRLAALEATVAVLVAQQNALGGAQERMDVQWVGFMQRVRTLAG